MPLDTLSATTKAPADAVPLTPAAAPAGIATLFSLLLEQTVSRNAPGQAATRAAPVLSNRTQARQTPSAPAPDTPPGDPLKAPVKAKERPPEDAALGVLVPPPMAAALNAPLALGVAPPKDAPAKDTGKVMDTAPLPGGESLPPPHETSLTPPPQEAAQAPAAVPPAGQSGLSFPSASAAPAAALPAPASSVALSAPEAALPAPAVSAAPAAALSAPAPVASVAALPHTSVAPLSLPSTPPAALPQAPAVLASPAALETLVAAAPAATFSAAPTPSATAGPTRPALAQVAGKTPAASAPVGLLPLPKLPSSPDAPPLLQNPARPADNQASPQTSNNTGLSEMGVKSGDPRKPAAGPTAGQGQKPPMGAEGALPTLLSSQPSSPALASGPPTPMPAPDRAQMLHQVSSGVQAMAAQTGPNGQRQMTLQLHPQDWGQVRVSVTMTPTTQADGKVTTQVVAHVVAEQPAVKAALETHQADLRQALKDAGLHLDRLTVTVQPASAGTQAGLGQSGHESRGGWEGTPSGATGTGPQSGAAGGGGGPSSFAAFGQGGQGSQGRPQAPPPYAPAGQPAEAEPENLLPAMRPGAGRVDTRA